MLEVYQAPLDLTADLPLDPPEPGRVAIYALIDPRDGAIRYIGKANDPVRRFAQHLGSIGWPSWHRQRARSAAWVRKLERLGLAPTIRVLAWVPSVDWAAAEVAYIAAAKDAGFSLVNSSIGGSGPTALTLAQRDAIRARQLGRPMSEEARAKIVALNRRKAKDPAFLATLSAALKRRWETDQEFAARERARLSERNASAVHRARMHEANTRKYAEHPDLAARIGAAHKQLWADPEYRERMVALLAAGCRTPQARARKSVVARERWADPEWRAQHQAKLQQAANTPEVRRARGESIRRAHAEDPTIRQRQSESNKRHFTEHPERAAHLSACMKEYWRRRREERARAQSDQYVQLPLF